MMMKIEARIEQDFRPVIRRILADQMNDDEWSRETERILFAYWLMMVAQRVCLDELHRRDTAIRRKQLEESE